MVEELAYYLMCRECGDGTIPVGPFDTPQQREEWIEQHTAETGHRNYLRRDHPTDPLAADFD